MYREIEIIAEVKTLSPFGFKSSRKWQELLETAIQIGDMISIHIDEKWAGKLEYLREARKYTDKPLFAKGINENDEIVRRAIEEYDARYVLVVGRIPGIYQERCIIEPRSLDEIARIPDEFKVLWNARNLETGNEKKENFEQAREMWKGWLCQASFIRNIRDIKEGANAVPVGGNLEEFARSLRYQ